MKALLIALSIAIATPAFACDGLSRNDVVAESLTKGIPLKSLTDGTLIAFLAAADIKEKMDEMLVGIIGDTDVIIGISSGCVVGKGQMSVDEFTLLMEKVSP